MNRALLPALAVGGVLAIASDGIGQTHSPLGQGMYAFHEGQYSRAIDYFNQAISRGTRDPRTYYFRGLAYGRMGDGLQAQADFRSGATLEARGHGHSVGLALQRVQGAERLELERVRRGALLAGRTGPPPVPREVRQAPLAPDFPPSRSPGSVAAGGVGPEAVRAERPLADTPPPPPNAAEAPAAEADSLDNPFESEFDDASFASDDSTPPAPGAPASESVDAGAVLGSVFRAMRGAALSNVNLDRLPPGFPGSTGGPGGPPTAAFPPADEGGAEAFPGDGFDFGSPPNGQPGTFPSGPATGPGAPEASPTAPPDDNFFGDPGGGDELFGPTRGEVEVETEVEAETEFSPFDSPAPAEPGPSPFDGP